MASLQLAVVLIAVDAGVVAWATFIERSCGAAAAHFAVYDSTWFTTINALLAVNVLCAVVARFPWNRRQTGFVVTHAGILVLLAGCLASQRCGVEAQLPIFEGHAAHRAYQDSYHFELEISPQSTVATSASKAPPTEVISIPFVSGPFAWKQYQELAWFPWHLAYRSRGVLYDEDGVTLEVLDYRPDPEPSARVRLTVNGNQKELELAALLADSSDEPAEGRHVVEGKGHRVTIALPPDRLDLGFQIYLHKFQRKLDPGTGTASHYSSLVDFLDLESPPQRLRENVLITLNAPVDFADPQTGLTYRLFQSSFSGPSTPGDAEFDRLVGKDRSRDEVFLSRLSVNYDPGRGLKYLGSLMIVAGIVTVYYLRARFARKNESPPLPADLRSLPGEGTVAKHLLLTAFVFIGLAGTCRAEDGGKLDWSLWQRLPVFGEGRVVPLDTFARETVEVICGRADPTLAPPGGPPHKFTAAELVFSWLAEPAAWQKTPCLLAENAELRERLLKLPLDDENGHRLRYASPAEVERNSEELDRSLEDLDRRERQAKAEGKDFRLTGADKAVKTLVNAYSKFGLLTFDPKMVEAMPRRFHSRIRLAAGAWRKLAGDLQGARRISRDDEIRRLMIQASQSLQQLLALMHGSPFTLEKVEPPVVAFCKSADQLAARLTGADDAPLAALAADLRNQAEEMHLALYDNGETLYLVPAIDVGALEGNRSPGDDAKPWLSFPAIVCGSDDLLSAYPQPELRSVRRAWMEAKGAYLDRKAADRAPTFTAAMARLAESLRALGQRIEPLREKLPLRHRDQELIAATAYPPAGSTDVEVLYNRLDPFFWSWLVSLAATLSLLLAIGPLQKLLFWLGVALLTAAQVLTVAGLGLRAYVSGLVPLTGMFETVVFVALSVALLGLWFALLPLLALARHGVPARMEEVLGRRFFALSGAIVSFVAMVLAYYAPSTVMHRNIGAVTPILRDNFWLAVHVVTIMASYAAAAMALILGNIALGYYLFGRYAPPRDAASPARGRRPPPVCAVLARFTYTAIQITVLLLTAGTILGALWADKSWGRFWGWDPKEAWALISLLVYLVILHARYVGWSGNFGMTVAAVFGFTAILCTWYGVNFLWGTGMHSYGTGAGGQIEVIGAVLLNWLFLAAAAIRHAIETAGADEG